MACGSCLCGAVRYEADAPFKWMAHCHCSMCRKDTGALFDTSLGVAKKQFRWLSGTDSIQSYASSEKARRTFCRHCGSDLPYEIADDSATYCIPAGSLDDDPGIKPQAHIFVRDKSPSDVIHDSLQQFATRPNQDEGPTVERAIPPLKPGVTEGSCLCGKVGYEYDGTSTRMTNCHCSRCRKSRGTAHATNVFVSQSKFRWTRGSELLKTFKVSDAQFFNTCFCSNCGGMLPAFFEGAKIYLTPVGSIDTPLEAKPGVHIYVNHKAPWFTIKDNLPQFPEMPPREQMFALMFEPR